MARWPFRPILLAAGALLVAGASRPARYVSPDEPAIAMPDGPGSQLAGAYCAACHSLDYITTQPRGKPAQFWKDSVTKMVSVYGAPIAPEEASQIADYLAATYGAQSN